MTTPGAAPIAGRSGATNGVALSTVVVRGNNVSLGAEECLTRTTDGVGYGDSYIIDPWGENVVRSRCESTSSRRTERSGCPDPRIGPAVHSSPK